MPLNNAQRVQDTAPPPDSSATSTTFVPKAPQRGSIWTMDQNTLLFNIALEKAEHNLAHDKRKAAVEEAGWATSPISVRPRTTAAIEEDDYTGEIPSEVKALATLFAGLPQGEIVLQPLQAYEPGQTPLDERPGRSLSRSNPHR